ncbi:MAG: type II toxin-antitoxin system RelE/ParE family toxin [Candidatus Sulfotelmatobacter sp.]
MRIRWTDPALQDFTQICDYIDQHSGGATSRRVALSIHLELDLLANFPECGRTGRKPNTRELVLSSVPYIVVYRIHDNSVEIVRILHGAQRWPK